MMTIAEWKFAATVAIYAAHISQGGTIKEGTGDYIYDEVCRLARKILGDDSS